MVHKKQIFMTNKITTLTLLVLVIVMSSFTKKNADQFVGTYGVSTSDPSQIKLIIHADETFYYQDFSVAENKIVVEGNWTMSGNKLVLKSNDITLKFHDVWTFEKDGQVAKSRKDFSFYRLCKIEN